MKRLRWAAVAASIAAASAALTMSAATAPITLIGTGLVPGNLLDLSGLDGRPICRIDDATACIDQATFGGWGSGLAYTGRDNVFLAAPDRGPFDGRTDTSYKDRVHFLHIDIDTGASFPNIQTTLLDTRFLKNESNAHFVGSSSAFNDDRPSETLRLDPEAVAISNDGAFFVSDEYGPYVFQFDRQGHLSDRLPVPDRFRLAKGGATGDVDAAGNSFELYPGMNSKGRQANRGMEGLAITPDGRTLVGIMQNALIQDNGLNSATPPGRRGITSRIVTFDLRTRATHEYVYVLDAIGSGRGVNEILAVNDHEFLVIERDNLSLRPTPPASPVTPVNKRIYRINLHKNGANDVTDVSGIASLPATAGELTAAGIVPVGKAPFIDLLDPTFHVSATQTVKDVIAEKIEGLAWGPDLRDGRHVLFVVSDNDLSVDLPTQIYAFAIDGSATGANLAYEPQRTAGPLYPPGQVKKALKDQK